jgi:hypothetical protein
MSNTQDFVLYSTGCVNCQDLEELLTDAGYKFTKVTDTAEMLQLGFETVPMLKIAPVTYLNYQEALDWLEEAKQNEK